MKARAQCIGENKFSAANVDYTTIKQPSRCFATDTSLTPQKLRALLVNKTNEISNLRLVVSRLTKEKRITKDSHSQVSRRVLPSTTTALRDRVTTLSSSLCKAKRQISSSRISCDSARLKTEQSIMMLRDSPQAEHPRMQLILDLLQSVLFHLRPPKLKSSNSRNSTNETPSYSLDPSPSPSSASSSSSTALLCDQEVEICEFEAMENSVGEFKHRTKSPSTTSDAVTKKFDFAADKVEPPAQNVLVELQNNAKSQDKRAALVELYNDVDPQLPISLPSEVFYQRAAFDIDPCDMSMKKLKEMKAHYKQKVNNIECDLKHANEKLAESQKNFQELTTRAVCMEKERELTQKRISEMEWCMYDQSLHLKQNQSEYLAVQMRLEGAEQQLRQIILQAKQSDEARVEALRSLAAAEDRLGDSFAVNMRKQRLAVSERREKILLEQKLQSERADSQKALAQFEGRFTEFNTCAATAVAALELELRLKKGAESDHDADESDSDMECQRGEAVAQSDAKRLQLEAELANLSFKCRNFESNDDDDVSGIVRHHIGVSKLGARWAVARGVDESEDVINKDDATDITYSDDDDDDNDGEWSSDEDMKVNVDSLCYNLNAKNIASTIMHRFRTQACCTSASRLFVPIEQMFQYQ